MALWAQWTGDGLTAGTIPDMSGNGRDLTNSGVQQVSSPFLPGGVALDFIADVSSAILDASVALPSEMTLALWVYSREQSPYYLSAMSPDFTELTLYGSAPALAYVGGTQVTNGSLVKFNNYAVIFQIAADGSVNIYINDLVYPAWSFSVSGFSAGGLMLGGWSVGTPLGSPYTLDGILGNIVIYDHLFTEAERTTWYNDGILSAPEPPVEPPAVEVSAISAGVGFRLTLTGSADSTTDVTLPLKNVHARLRSGSPSYLSTTIPYTSELAALITDRPNGDLALEYLEIDSAGAETTSEVVTVALEGVQISRGVSSSSIVLTGHRQSTNGSPATHEVRPSSLQDGSTSRTMIVPGYDPGILPADTVSAEGVSYAVGTIELQAGVSASGFSCQAQYVEAG